ncbi:putative membrane protein [Sphingomonas naasensis]|uniref:glycosyltransferase family 39 protein n=1 Tax=Sphingomonas naasensis TaxID=1344951 RepID=UPI00141A8ED7|nr:glycosyltransferase family 39 protein [Sphingomonas naasensis]NIJ22019.1 putative membrane protein [Sphingomonas naasensis]
MTRGAAGAEWSRGDLLVVPVLLGAIALRIVSAGYSLWFDEIAAVTLAHQPLDHLWSGWMAREANPPLYYTLLKGWMALFGSGDLAVQLLSVAIGTAGIGAAWWAARRLGGTGAGLIAALLLAISPAHLDFSQEVRSYILAQTAALFACAAIILYLERPRLAPLAGYALAAGVALYAHTTMALFVGLSNFALFWLLRRDRPALLRWILANALVAMLWSWWAWISLGQAAGGDTAFGWITRPDLPAALTMTATVYLPFYVASERIVFAPLLALAWLGGLGWFAARDRRPAVVLLAALTLAAPLLLWAVSQRLPIFLPRTLFWAAGPATVLLAVALAAVPSRPMRGALVALLVALQIGALLRWLPERETEAWPQTLATIARIDPHAAVIVEGDAMGVAAEHYRQAQAPGLRIFIVQRPAGAVDRWAEGLVAAPHLDAGSARALLAREGRLFTLARGDYDPAWLFAGIGVAQPLPESARNRQPHLASWRVR